MIVPSVREEVWEEYLDGVPVWEPPLLHTLVVVPHPDDETLAAGGLIRWLRSKGVAVTVVAVTDGEAAYGVSAGLAEIREREQAEALRRLGVAESSILRLRMPDSGVSRFEDELVKSLMSLVDEGTHMVAPWQGDFHPDHEACGRAAERVAKAKGVALTSYFFWTWHRGTTGLLDGFGLVKFPLSEKALAAKGEALRQHVSQLEHESGAPILPEDLLGPARRPYEVFLV